MSKTALWCLTILPMISATGSLSAADTRISLHDIPAAHASVSGANRKHTCKVENQIDPYPIWREIRSNDQARDFLKDRYRQIGSFDTFVDWLACQSFVVETMSYPALNLRQGDRLIIAVFYIATLDRKPLWGQRWWTFPPIYSQSAILTIDDSNRIKSISIEYTSE